MGATDSARPADVTWSRRLVGAASSIVWVVGALVVGWFLWPSSLGGCTTLTIVSGRSMEPTYVTGDLVVSRCGQVEVGDVIVYSPPNVGGARVIHRIIGGDEAGWVVQGDNNDFLDPWMPVAQDIHGSAVLHLPQVGRFASILLSPLTWVSLMVVALAVIVWPGRETQDLAHSPESGDDPAPEPDVVPDEDLLQGLGAAPAAPHS
ncbi:signal peptidase I [Actinotalea sp. K2]|uniref:signal peptidase I n=1 Tax=Actinotalea sp. K2 TaxID=2939438 RepID=UPI00201786F4|nr:signal peptidase I [Actinotalea sp. K2]MCL3861510.1 signal peptidase I [Actinotalea sp. K2]